MASEKIMKKKDRFVTDMTTGSPMKHILLFALPLLVGNVFQQLYNMVDSLIVGNFVGANALAAVGACGSMNFLFFALCSGISNGIGVIVSQYFGAGDEKGVKDAISNAIYSLGGVAVLVSVLAYITSPTLLRWLATPESVINDSITYMRVLSLGIVGVALYNCVASIMRALGDSKTPLYFLILSSFVNIALDLTFVLFCGWGVFGVALATIISQFMSGLASVTYAIIKIPFFRLKISEMKPKRDIIIKTFTLGTPLALQSSMIAISCMVLQGVVNTFGEIVMAAFTITSRIESIVQMPYMTLGMSITTFAGQNIGAGHIDRVRESHKCGFIIVLIFSLIMIPVAYLFGEPIVGLFVKEAEVIDIGARALRITSLCYIGLGMIYVPRALLNGVGDTGFSMINGITEVACRIGYSKLLVSFAWFGWAAIWITTGLTWVTTAVICHIRYRSGVWMTKRIVKE